MLRNKAVDQPKAKPDVQSCTQFNQTSTVQNASSVPVHKLKLLESSANVDVRFELTTLLKKFCDGKRIVQNIKDTIPDTRDQDAITYPKESIIMTALLIFLTRQESGNDYDESSGFKFSKYSKKNIANFIGAPDGCAPVIKTVEDFLKTLDPEHINNLMINFFKDLQKSKFFKDHSQIVPGDVFHLAFDCIHTHTYKHPHHADSEGNNDCPFCLKRVYNKGTEKEKVRWMHNTLVGSFVFLGNLKIPIYSAPLYAKQVADWENASDEKHKQECELVALKRVLPIVREHFPKMKLIVLLDGLYANRPAIRLLEKFNCGYSIVRKEASFTSVAKACLERSVTSHHTKNHTKKIVFNHNEWKIERKYEWFNFIDIGDEKGDLTTNVLKIKEIRKKEGEKDAEYNCEWLCSQRLSAQNCDLVARNARLRWEIEDLFNTMATRGFNLKHDYSRHPHSCSIWPALGLLSFSVFELFRFSEPVKKLCENASLLNIAKALQRQLFAAPTDDLFPEGYELKKIQFRYNFVIGPVCSTAISYNDPLRVPRKRPKKQKVKLAA